MWCAGPCVSPARPHVPCLPASLSSPCTQPPPPPAPPSCVRSATSWLPTWIGCAWKMMFLRGQLGSCAATGEATGNVRTDEGGRGGAGVQGFLDRPPMGTQPPTLPPAPHTTPAAPARCSPPRPAPWSRPGRSWRSRRGGRRRRRPLTTPRMSWCGGCGARRARRRLRWRPCRWAGGGAGEAGEAAQVAGLAPRRWYHSCHVLRSKQAHTGTHCAPPPPSPRRPPLPRCRRGWRATRRGAPGWRPSWRRRWPTKTS